MFRTITCPPFFPQWCSGGTPSTVCILLGATGTTFPDPMTLDIPVTSVVPPLIRIFGVTTLELLKLTCMAEVFTLSVAPITL